MASVVPTEEQLRVARDFLGRVTAPTTAHVEALAELFAERESTVRLEEREACARAALAFGEAQYQYGLRGRGLTKCRAEEPELATRRGTGT